MNRVLVACTLTMVLLVLDSSIIGVMLPSIGQELDLSSADVAWVVSGYLLALAVLLPIGGRVADAIGPVTAFVVGMAGFAVASAGIAFSGSDLALISWRAVAGAAAALLMPATLSIILGEFVDDARARALAVYAGVGQAFATVGPAVGGLCAEFLGWQWGFLINVPVGAAGIALILMARPANRRTASTGFDVPGAILLVVGATAIVTALIQLPVWGLLAWPTLACAGIGVVGLVAFVVHCRRVADPVLNLRMFASRPFTGGALVLAVLGFGMTVATIYGAITLQQTLGFESRGRRPGLAAHGHPVADRDSLGGDRVHPGRSAAHRCRRHRGAGRRADRHRRRCGGRLGVDRRGGPGAGRGRHRPAVEPDDQRLVEHCLRQ